MMEFYPNILVKSSAIFLIVCGGSLCRCGGPENTQVFARLVIVHPTLNISFPLLF